MSSSGVGLATGQRLIREFLESRKSSSHIVLIPTTRTEKKSRQTIEYLRAYVRDLASGKVALRRRVGPDYNPKSVTSRVHILSVELDLCKLASIYAAAERLLNGKLRDPTGVIADGGDVSISHLDAVVLNAGFGGWTGVDWLGAARQICTRGIVQSTTFPSFKIAAPTLMLPAQVMEGTKIKADTNAKQQPYLAEVFCANVFGHYLFARELLPLLSRANASEAPGRIIWTSSIDAEERHLDFSDFQALNSKGPYESSKRITDLISIGADLPKVRKISDAYFSAPSVQSRPIKPKFYLSHPGVVHTALFPLNAFLFFWYGVLISFARALGSAWHTIESYKAACAAVWLVLIDQESLDATNAHCVKWGSSVARWNDAVPKKTEVEGWGWEGRIEDNEALKNDFATGQLRKLKGRKWDAVCLTEEKRIKFEEDSLRCWEELERLRGEWERILGRDPSACSSPVKNEIFVRETETTSEEEDGVIVMEA
jgi:3-keto steroid reductase